MRSKQRIFRTVMMAVIAIGLISLSGGCRKKGPLERAGKKVDHAVQDAGEAVKDAADKTKEAAEDAADKVGEVVDDATDKINEPTPTPSD